jgi:competence protein ComEC
MHGIKKINQSIPILRHTIVFLAGILISNILFIGNKHLIIILLTFFLIAFLSKRSRNVFLHKIYTFTIAFIITGLGIFYANIYHNSMFRYDIPTQGLYIGKVTDTTPASKNREKLSVKLKQVETYSSTKKVNEKIVLYVPDAISDSGIIPGDYIGFNAKLYPVENSNNPGEFDYRKYMRRKGVRYQAYLSFLPENLNHREISLKTMAVNARSKLLKAYREAGIGNQEFAVLSALTLGEKGYIDKDLKQHFSNSGAMHVLAVSGLHVGILFFVFSFMLKPLNHSRKTRIIKVILLIILLWGYALITGMSPSVLRATTMFSFLVIGQNINRNTNIYNTLALSALLLMIINPDIIYETGFQLSYTAVVSIVFFQPKIVRLLPAKNRITKAAWGLVAVSLSAQIGTLPLSLFYFHQFPVYFWISNFIVMPAATVLLYGSILFFVLLPFTTINGFIGSCLSVVAKLMNFLIAKVDNLPGAVISDIWIDKSTVMIIYAMIFTLGLVWVYRNYKYIVVIASFFLVLTVKQTINSHQTSNQSYVIFYNHYNEKLLSIINGREHYFYGQSDSLPAYSKTLLNNASGYFRTREPVHLCQDTLLNKALYLSKNHIFFKNIQIQIKKDENKLKKKNNNTAQLIWDINSSEINVNKRQNIAIHSFKNNKLSYFRPAFENDDSTINLNRHAVIVETW